MKFSSWFGLLLCAPLFGLSQNNRDAAFWLNSNVDNVLNKHNSLHLTNQWRLNENFTHFDYFYADLGIDHQVNKWLQITCAYVLNLKNSTTRGLQDRHQFYVNFTTDKKLGKFKLSNRAQFQTEIEDRNFNDRGGFPDLFYRNKSVIKYRYKKKIEPYVASELYFRVNHFREYEAAVYRFRFTFGVDLDLKNRFAISPYFMLQQQQTVLTPIYTFVYGFRVNYTIRNKNNNDDSGVRRSDNVQ